MSPNAHNIALCIAMALPGTPAAAQQEQAPSGWRDALQRFERDLDALLDRLVGPAAQVQSHQGILVPAGPGPEHAAALPDQWVPLESPAPASLVLLVHGLDEPGDIWAELAPALVEAGHRVARFEYPNDQRIRDSSALMVEHLRQARSAGVERVAIVAHSMGGLVSLHALTRPDGYGGRVRSPEGLPGVTHLVAVGTPWEGSPVARLQPLSELREQASRMLQEGSFDPRPFLDYRRDGSAQAAEDLSPGSEVLEELAAEPWPEGLRTAILAGRIGEPERALGALADTALLRRLVDPEDLEALTSDLARLSRHIGDGVVPVDSATARPADRVEVFGVNHRALIRRSPVDFLTGRGEADPETGETPPPGIPVVLEFLGPPEAR